MEFEDIVDDFKIKMASIGFEIEEQLTFNSRGEVVAVKFKVVGRLA